MLRHSQLNTEVIKLITKHKRQIQTCLSLTSDNKIRFWCFAQFGSIFVETPVNADDVTKLCEGTDLSMPTHGDLLFLNKLVV